MSLLSFCSIPFEAVISFATQDKFHNPVAHFRKLIDDSGVIGDAPTKTRQWEESKLIARACRPLLDAYGVQGCPESGSKRDQNQAVKVLIRDKILAAKLLFSTIAQVVHFQHDSVFWHLPTCDVFMALGVCVARQKGYSESPLHLCRLLFRELSQNQLFFEERPDLANPKLLDIMNLFTLSGEFAIGMETSGEGIASSGCNFIASFTRDLLTLAEEHFRPSSSAGASSRKRKRDDSEAPSRASTMPDGSKKALKFLTDRFVSSGSNVQSRHSCASHLFRSSITRSSLFSCSHHLRTLRVIESSSSAPTPLSAEHERRLSLEILSFWEGCKNAASSLAQSGALSGFNQTCPSLEGFLSIFVTEFIDLWKVAVMFSDFSSLFAREAYLSGETVPMEILKSTVEDQFTSALIDVLKKKTCHPPKSASNQSISAAAQMRSIVRLQWSYRGPDLCEVHDCTHSTITSKLCWVCKKHCHPSCAYSAQNNLQESITAPFFTTCSKRCWLVDQDLAKESKENDKDLESDSD